MKWMEVRIPVPEEDLDPLVTALTSYGIFNMQIEDPNDVLTYEPKWTELLDKAALAKEMTAAVTIYFDETTGSEDTLIELTDYLKAYGIPPSALAHMSCLWRQESEWANAWKDYYHAERVTRFLTVVPSWESYVPETFDERIIQLDPGMAFGTGTHATTRLCLMALEMILRGGETVFDVGTGSGVLSIAAKVLGADHVWACDIDPVAVLAAQENIQLNPMAAGITVVQGDLLKDTEATCDVLVSNLLADILSTFPEDAYQTIRPGGYWISSGIVTHQVAPLLELMERAGFLLYHQYQEADWVCLIMRKPNLQG